MTNFLEKYTKALEEEYQYLSKFTPRISLFDGKLEYEGENYFVYSFTLNKEVGIPDGTPICVYNNMNRILGSVLYAESYEIVIKVPIKINLTAKSEFTSSVQDLLRALIEKLTEMDYGDPLIRLLIQGKIFRMEGDPLQGQGEAKAHAFKNPITVIWGPPGTGKTHTLAEIALRFFEQGKSVLIVSQSNIAVDNAMRKVKEFVQNPNVINPPFAYEGNVEGKIFRAGYSKITEVVLEKDEKDFYINARQYVEKTNPELIKTLEETKKQWEKEQSPWKKQELTNQIRRIREFIHLKEEELIRSAKILGTTISKATVDTLISQRKFDVVLFDEASMAYVPQIVYACSLAKSHFICIGDFRQLPPIVQSSEENILNKDIFDFLGIYESDCFSNHHWLVMLNNQRRMHPKISGFVKERIYSNFLDDYDNVQNEKQFIIEKGPAKNLPITYFDIDQISCCANKKEVGRTSSHFNFVSASISVLIALKAKAAGQESVAIISPYKNQVNLIKAILLDLGVGQADGVFCSTIHQFQGRESNVIIFDTVDASPMVKMGKMLQGGDNAKRLINVAMTRAKGKFILVGSKRRAQEGKILGYLWQYVQNNGKGLSLKALLKENLHHKLQVLSSGEEVVQKITGNKKGMIASFNKQMINCNPAFFDILGKVDVSEKDYVFIDKDVEEKDLTIVGETINHLAHFNIAYKGVENADNLILIGEKQTVVPICSLRERFHQYIHLTGGHTINVLMELAYESMIEASEMQAPIKAVKAVDLTKLVQCPICEINLMPLGSRACAVCLPPKPSKAATVKEGITLKQICNMLADLLQEHRERFWIKKCVIVEKVIKANHKIARIQDAAPWDPTKKTYYYDKDDVFGEFFVVHHKVGPAIKVCKISNYAELERKLAFVSTNIK